MEDKASSGVDRNGLLGYAELRYTVRTCVGLSKRSQPDLMVFSVFLGAWYGLELITLSSYLITSWLVLSLHSIE